MEPTTKPDPVIDFAVRSPATIGLALLVPGVLLLALAGWLGYRGFGFAAKDKAEVEAKAEDPLQLKPADPSTGSFLWGMVFGLAAAAPLLIVSAGFLTSSPEETPAARTRARTFILAAGGILGVVLMLAGLFFFGRWVDGLLKYLDDNGTVKDLRWPLYALVTLLLGAACLFLSVQPARADERNQPMLRRLIYSANLALVLLLLVAVLLAGNVIAARKVPNTLDTTASGFYTLSPDMTKFLQNMDQPVTAYGIFPAEVRGQRGRAFDDTRRLLKQCQEVSNGKLTFKFIGPTTPQSEFEVLVKKYPDVELNVLGVLLTTGEDGKRHAFIKLNDLRTTVGEERKEMFVGEARILKELQFLTENTARPVVYFTQSNGELQITVPEGGERLPPTQTAVKLKEYLEKNFMDVRPLELKVGKLEVPSDATVLVIAQPATPFSKEAAESLRKFVTEPRAEGKKGKLVVLAGTPLPPEGPVSKLGIEDLLKELNIEYGNQYMYAEKRDRLLPEVMAVMVYPPAVEAGNPVARAFAAARMAAPGWRTVMAKRDRPAIQAMPLLITIPGREVWFEDTPLLNPELTMARFNEPGSEALQRAKGLTDVASVAVVASEGNTRRAAAFGNSLFISDAAAAVDPGTPRSFEIMSSTIDWLRERPTVGAGLAGKTYEYFRINPGLDTARLQWLPLAFAVFAILGIGAGVWAVRRR